MIRSCLIHFLACIVLALFFPTIIKAQVSIGMIEEPNEGALLDLKEYDSSNSVTATKGLALPRVALSSINNLYPMFEDDTDYTTNKDNKKDTEDLLHIGLTVYNVETDFCNEMYPGIYVWYGTEWVPLESDSFSGEVGILIDDRDPNQIEKYRIGKFGDAGWWMLENLRATIWAPNSTEGTGVADPVLEMPVSTAVDPEAKPTYNYPKGSSDDLAANPHHGYMYNMYAALRITEENYLDNSFELTGRQGICPDGWRIPSFSDWEKLAFSIEKNGSAENGEVYKNPCKYAHSNINVNTGYNMISMEDSSKGKSRIPKQGGFNGNLLGRITAAKGSIEVGKRAHFWLGFRHPTLAGGFTGLLLDDYVQAAYWQPMERRTQASVRCVKND